MSSKEQLIEVPPNIALNESLNVRFGLRFQSVDATHWPKHSAGVLKCNVSLGLSLSLLATAFNLFW